MKRSISFNYRVWKHKVGERGVLFVEVAVIFSILILLSGGVINFGYFFSDKIALNNVSRIVARTLARRSMPGDAISELTNQATELSSFLLAREGFKGEVEVKVSELICKDPDKKCGDSTQECSDPPDDGIKTVDSQGILRPVSRLQVEIRSKKKLELFGVVTALPYSDACSVFVLYNCYTMMKYVNFAEKCLVEP